MREAGWRQASARAEAEEMAAAAHAAGVHAAIDLQLRASPAVKRACEAVTAGMIGRLLSASDYSSTAGFGPDVPAPFLYLADPDNFANLVTIQGAHPIDLALAAAGPLAAERGLESGEYELIDTGAFDGDRYFDVGIEYAKAAPEDMLIRITVSDRGPEPAPLCMGPTLTLRNNRSWRTLEPSTETRPWMALRDGDVVANHTRLGRFRLVPLDGIAEGRDSPEILFTENDTNVARLDRGTEAQPGFTKDAFDHFLVRGEVGAVNPEQRGTKAAFLHRLTLGAGAEIVLRYRLAREDEVEPAPMDAAADRVFAERRGEADVFYDTVIAETCSDDERAVSRQAYAGLPWSKQFYYYVAECWQQGDPAQPAPPEARATNASED